MCFDLEWKLYTCQNSSQDRTVEKNSSSTIGLSTGIEPRVAMPGNKLWVNWMFLCYESYI